ncbi:hypothetical protein LIER_19413 [Lithospermum erythrorhizon]|uniref:RNase H type-1 domain-containing protein n=1 Tax=Lithospermum erythrorhizon TaxID=34254 RepID=A0AAV3QIK5_LITER
MQPPRKYKDIQKLTGCLVAISRFISKSELKMRRSGAGIQIRGLDNIIIEYALRFIFPTTKNEAEYEAMVARLAIVRSLGLKRIWVKSNSKLVMDQTREVPACQEAVTLPVSEELEDWRTPIAQYLVKGQLPGNGIEA